MIEKRKQKWREWCRKLAGRISRRMYRDRNERTKGPRERGRERRLKQIGVR